MICTGLLLAAGASRRFGPRDKLLASLDGRPLIAHAAVALRGAGLDECIAVIANPDLVPYLSGFRIVQIRPGGQADSLKAGLAAAGAPDRLLIALGDMPHVTTAHLLQVLGRASDVRPAASTDGIRVMPPACFPAAWLARLAALRGDRGAGSLIRNLPGDALIPAPGMLADIDLPADLARSHEAAQSGRPPRSSRIPLGSGGSAPGGRGTQ